MKSLKPHIGIFGRRNVGKSSFINAITNQEVAIVSDLAGTTTDPVKKNLEIPGVGASVIIDTAGIDDSGEVGLKRIAATKGVFRQVDLAIILMSANTYGSFEQELIGEFEKLHLPFFLVHNKADLARISPALKKRIETEVQADVLDFSAIERHNLDAILEQIRKQLPDSAYNNPSILGDLVSYGDVVLLVTPIDIEAPQGRIILPQVQTIRDALDNDCIIVMLKEREIDSYFRRFPVKPRLVVTDSQVFLKVDAAIPKDMALTSFSILFARMKGDFEAYIGGARAIGRLNDGDRVLILESCAHHVTGDDIGRVKIPRWLANFTGKQLHFEVVAGLNNAPRDLHDYRLVIQCGGCMLTRKQVLNRIKPAIAAGIPVTNYGMAIAYCHGIFDRAIAPFFPEQEAQTDRYL